MLLTGKTAVITGCSRGIGRETVELFAKNGADVWAHFRKETDEYLEFCACTQEKYKTSVRPLFFDITDEVSVKEVLKNVKKDMKKVDILVNNAGVGGSKKVFQMTSVDEMREIMDINFFSHMRLTQYFVKYMVKQQSGSIINMSSVAGLYGEPSMLPYVASKGAMASATKKLASEYGFYGIRVNAVAPGVTYTDMTEAISDEYKKRLEDETMLGRLANPTDIANVILFLASDLSGYVTGQVIEVNGGLKI